MVDPKPIISMNVVTRNDYSKRSEEYRALSQSFEKWFITTLLVASTASLSFVVSKLLSTSLDDSHYLSLLISTWILLLAMVFASLGYLNTLIVVHKKSQENDILHNLQDTEIGKKEFLNSAKETMMEMAWFQQLSLDEKIKNSNDITLIRKFLDVDSVKYLQDLELMIETGNKNIELYKEEVSSATKKALRSLYASIFFLAGGYLLPIIYETYLYVCK